jgi:predicted dehydrogenase
VSRPLDVLLVGIGGYGNNYVSALLDATDPSACRLAGCVDPAPGGCNRLDELRRRGVPIHDSLDGFFARSRADLAVVSTPLHLHAKQTVQLLQQGSHVLCEKPLCVTPGDIRLMASAERQAGRTVAVGYQWSFSTAIQALKRDVVSGEFGRPLRFRTLVLWPRDRAYYQRSCWAGRQRDDAGEWVLDSPVNNACAHFLHNMFFLLGPAMDRSAAPAVVLAELCRAYPIENYDTAAVRCTTTGGVELLFITSHVVADHAGPQFEFEFERAVVEYRGGPAATICARFADGSTRDYGSPNDDRMRKLWRTLEDVREQRPSACGIAAAMAQTRCAWAVQQAPGGILGFSKEDVRVEDAATKPRLVVNGLGAALLDCYRQWKLPSELGLPWSRPSQPVVVEREAIA